MHDPYPPVVDRLLEAIEAALDAVDAPVCRLFWHPGSTAPWDACGTTDGGAEGQAWVATTRVYPVRPFPTQDTGAQRCAPIEYAADVIVGALRCAATVDDQGRSPTVAQVSADAAKVSRDRTALLDALLCRFLTDESDPGTFRLGDWTPLGPNGGCVGGQWSATIRLPACPCD